MARQGLRLLLDGLQPEEDLLHKACDLARNLQNTEGLALLLEKQNHSLVVMGTENLEAVYGFTSNAANIVQGRSFIQEEYDSGAKVCILGETVANASGISVGDTITLEQYLCEENNISVDDEPWDGKQNNPDIGRLNIRTEYGPAEEFTVVGLYRQRDEWGDSSYSFTHNTIFIPQAAQIDGA